MVVFESLKEIGAAGTEVVGSKAKSLAQLAKQGFRVPAAICISTEFYEAYITGTGLRDRVLFELGRKPFEEMRWEEIWDAALRIRNLFLATPLPETLHATLHATLARVFGDRPVPVSAGAGERIGPGGSDCGSGRRTAKARFPGGRPAAERTKAGEMLDLARASHRWRDDENVVLNAVEAQWRAAQTEVRPACA